MLPPLEKVLLFLALLFGLKNPAPVAIFWSFWMVEPEMAFYSYKEAMILAENLVEYVVQNTIQKQQKFTLKLWKEDTSALEKNKSPLPPVEL